MISYHDHQQLLQIRLPENLLRVSFSSFILSNLTIFININFKLIIRFQSRWLISPVLSRTRVVVNIILPVYFRVRGMKWHDQWSLLASTFLNSAFVQRCVMNRVTCRKFSFTGLFLYSWYEMAWLIQFVGFDIPYSGFDH